MDVVCRVRKPDTFVVLCPTEGLDFAMQPAALQTSLESSDGANCEKRSQHDFSIEHGSDWCTMHCQDVHDQEYLLVAVRGGPSKLLGKK